VLLQFFRIEFYINEKHIFEPKMQQMPFEDENTLKLNENHFKKTEKYFIFESIEFIGLDEPDKEPISADYVNSLYLIPSRNGKNHFSKF
jgi:hypothetical protein